MQDVTHILVGKQTKAFQRRAGKNVPENMCLSVVTTLVSLDLEASQQQIRDAWVAALRQRVPTAEIMRQVSDSSREQSDSDKEKDSSNEMNTGKEPKKQNGANVPVTTSSSSSPVFAASTADKNFVLDFSKLDISPDKSSILFEDLQRGVVFTKFPEGMLGLPQKKFVFLEGARIFWCDLSKRVLDEKKSLMLPQVKEILLGKQTKALNKTLVKSTSADRCFSVVTLDRSLDLAADSATARDEWVFAVVMLIKQRMRRVINVRPEVGGTLQSLATVAASHAEVK
jgi:hypothetical protein